MRFLGCRLADFGEDGRARHALQTINILEHEMTNTSTAAAKVEDAPTIICRIDGNGVTFRSVDPRSINETEDGSWTAWAVDAPAPQLKTPFFDLSRGRQSGGVHLRASSRRQLLGLIRSMAANVDRVSA